MSMTLTPMSTSFTTRWMLLMPHRDFQCRLPVLFRCLMDPQKSGKQNLSLERIFPSV